MSLPQVISSAVEQSLSKYLNTLVTIKETHPVSGGCINHTVGLTTNQGKFFLKYNDAKLYPEMFSKEAKGLSLLRSEDTINTPEVIDNQVSGNYSWLLLEHIESGPRKLNFWEDFGFRLSELHKITHDSFGLDHDNYIGSLVQHNDHHNNWTDFFIQQRLMPQIELANKNGLLNSEINNQFEHLFKRLPNIFPEESPALLHGDLWSGNFMVNNQDEVCLIDPAVYFGHREMELAFTKLFGGFENHFYEAYNENKPLEPGFIDRVDIYNLYPLLVHANLFGKSYLRPVRETINLYF